MEFSMILNWILTGSSGIGLVAGIAYYRQTKRMKVAEANQKEVEVEKAMIDVRKAETDRLLAQVDHQQQTIRNLIDVNTNLSGQLSERNGRLSELNKSLDKYRDRNREIADRLYKAESEINHVNDRLTESQNLNLRLTEERDEANQRADYNEMWRCERTDCQDPRGPRPPRDKLRGLTYCPAICTPISSINP